MKMMRVQVVSSAAAAAALLMLLQTTLLCWLVVCRGQQQTQQQQQQQQLVVAVGRICTRFARCLLISWAGLGCCPTLVAQQQLLLRT
jgi:hypothetical protein